MSAMTDEEYRAWMDALSGLVRGLRLVPVAGLLEVVSVSEAVGPVLEPTLYARGGATNLDHQRRVLEAVAAVQRVAEDVTGQVLRG